MKVLWICNLMLPQIAEQLNEKPTFGGGWMTGLAGDLAPVENIELEVCFPYGSLVEGMAGKIKYYSFYNESSLYGIISRSNPDVVHIFGTEYKHSFYAANACKQLGIADKVVISIQGLISFAAKHYFGGIPEYVKYGRTLRDIIKRNSINKSKKAFETRSEYEKKALNLVNHVIGRTDWDYACVKQLAPNVKYHFCNETLRGTFYENQWSIENCDRYSVFVSQCNYPLKGFHRVLEAMSIVAQHYPEAKLYTTGRNLMKKNDFVSSLKRTYYENYLKKLIKKYNLEKSIVFLGPLDEEKMCERYIKSHVFVASSSVENSPNSLGEAMILGVPTVTSDVGGIKALFNHNEDGIMYQADAPYMMADAIMKIFESDELAKVFSENAKKHAKMIHNRENNLNKMMKIYSEIIGGKTSESV